MHDPLNPDSEQQLFEELSNSKEDLQDLETVRRLMKHIIKLENNEKQNHTGKLDTVRQHTDS